MKINILNSFPAQGFNPSHRKEKFFKRQITAFSKDHREVITIRFYDPGGRTDYCCVWINAKYFPDYPNEDISYKNSKYAYGSGSSTGESSLWEALKNSGIEITGLRDSEATEAVKAICEHFRADILFIHEAHA